MATTEPEEPLEWDDFPMRTHLQGPTPPVSLSLSISSPSYSLSTGLDGRPTLCFTAISHFNHPITLFIYRTVLDENQAFSGTGIYQKISATNVATGQRVWFGGSSDCRFYPPVRLLGHRDAKYFLTLHPNKPVTVNHAVPCSGLHGRFDDGGKGNLSYAPSDPEFQGEEFRKYFEAGQTYRIGVQNMAQGIQRK